MVTPPPTHGLVLAAGRGARLGRTGARVPKPLLDIAGDPLIVRMIRQMHEGGIRDVHVVLGHEAVRVRAAIDAHPIQNEVTLHYVTNDDYATTNNIVSLALGLRSVAEVDPDVAVVAAECDIVMSDRAMAAFLDEQGGSSLVVSPFRSGMDGTVVTLVGDVVERIVPPREQPSTFDFGSAFKTVNIYRFEPDLWSAHLTTFLDWYLQHVGVTDYYEYAVSLLLRATNLPLRAFVIPASEWSEVDDPNDLRAARIRWDDDFRHRELATSHGGYWHVDAVDHSYLRNMYFPTPSLLAQLRTGMEESLHNYGSAQSVLDLKMSWLLDIADDAVLFVPGLAAAFPALAHVLAGRRTLIPEPTFGEYAARFPGADTYPAEADTGELQAALDRVGPDVLVIVNPNNPTGTYLPSDSLADLARSNPGVVILVDESFLGFSNEPSLLDRLGELPNVIVLCSLSKTMGVPGLRIGYVASADRAMLAAIRTEMPIWAANSLAERFLEFSLKYRSDLAESLERTLQDREAFRQRLAAEPCIDVRRDTEGNFVLVSVPSIPAEGAEAVTAGLFRRGYLVKDLTDRLGAPVVTLRLAVRTPDENDALTAALVDTIAEIRSGSLPR